MKRDFASPVVVAALLTALLWNDGAPGWSWGEQVIQAGAASARQASADAARLLVTLGTEVSAGFSTGFSTGFSIDKEAQ